MKPHTLSAGVVVVRRHRDGPRYLLLRAYEYWDFPKGMVEPGEEPLAAAVREVMEETGLSLRPEDFRWGKGYQETPPYGMGKVARYYVAESLQGEPYLPVNPALGKPEHEEWRWVSYEEARRLLSSRLKSVLNWADWMVQWESSAEAAAGDRYA